MRSKHFLISALIGLMPLEPVLHAASSLPTGGNFTAGRGNINTNGNVLTVTQNSLKGIIDWNTFSVGKGLTVSFKNGSGATLNLVTGGTPSTILGQLLATGTVYLLNPEGVLIGKGATVRTGGDFVASTLTLPAAQFLSKAPLLFSGSSEATVVNLGSISSSGGDIYLIGRSVQNGGSLASANGTTGLAAGSRVLLSDSDDGQKVAVQAPGGDVTNSGFISAARVELKSNGGNIYALAGSNGGYINATGAANIGGHVWLIATNGTTNVSGPITAVNADGTGGDVETSGAHVNAGGAEIRTGKGGNWLLDPADLTIDSGLASTIETSLNGGTSVTEQTSSSGSGGSGDITVASSIAWTGAADLTLSAYRNIGFNAGVVISNNGSGNLTLRADNASRGSGTVSFANTNQIDFSSSTGDVAILYNPSSYSSPTDYSTNVITNGSWSAPADGSVTSQYTAYMLVNTAADLENISNNAYGTYALGQDIDLSGVSNFTPVAGNAPYGNFWGIFDGMGHTVSSVTLSSLNTNDVGFFQSVIGQVRNLNLVNVDLTTNSNNETAGGLSAELQGTVSNTSVSGVIHAGSMTNQLVDLVGGLVGTIGFGATVQNSHASVTVDAGANNNAALGGNLKAGGLAGDSLPGVTISNSFATGSVTGGNGATVGGLIGNAAYSQISTSYATGNVTGGTGALVGGLVGDNASTLTDTYARGNVTGGDSTAQVGGLVGYLESGGSVTTSYSSGLVSPGAGANVGGLVGQNAGSANITSSYWDKDASGFSTVGVGSGDSTGAVGLTTAQLKSGTMPSGFNPNVSDSPWIAPANVYPYFGWQGPLVTIDGIAYNGTSAISSATVGALSGGTLLGTTTTNSSGFYFFQEPQNMTQLGGVLTYLASNGTANTFSDGASLNHFEGMELVSGSLAILNAASTYMSGLSAAMSTTLGSNSGADFLFSAPSGPLSISPQTNLLFYSFTNFSLNQALNIPGSLLMDAAGNLVLGSSVTAGSGHDITIGVGGTFKNNFGANVLGVSGGGRWLIYSQNPEYDADGGLTPAFKQYNATFGETTPAQSGDGLLYTLAPVVTPSLTGTASKTYDGTTAASLSASNIAVSGAIDGDVLTFAAPSGATYSSPNAGTGIGVTLPGLAIASASNAGIPVYGYQLASSSASGEIGTINPALLTYTANAGSRTYGASNPIFTGTVTGFVDGQTLATATTGTAAFTSSATSASNVGTYAIEGSGLTARNGNYVFSQADANASALTIDPATLTYTANPVTRSYGVSNPVFSGTVTGFVNGQTLGTATTGTALFTSDAGVTSVPGSYAIDGSGLTANHGNYVFTQAAGNATALTIATASSAPPTPTPPPSSPTVLTFVIANANGLQNSDLTFSANYTGSAISGVDIASILSGLSFTVTPSVSGPGTYTISGVGTAPAGYALNIVPATLTLVGSTPAVLPTQAPLIIPVVPRLLPNAGGNEATSLLPPLNSVGLFQINVSGSGNSSLGASFIGFGSQQAPMAQSGFFGSNDKKDTYSAGAKAQ